MHIRGILKLTEKQKEALKEGPIKFDENTMLKTKAISYEAIIFVLKKDI